LQGASVPVHEDILEADDGSVADEEDLENEGEEDEEEGEEVGEEEGEEEGEEGEEVEEGVEGEKQVNVKREPMASLVVRAFCSTYDHCMSNVDVYKFVIANCKTGEYTLKKPGWKKNVRHIITHSHKAYFTNTGIKAEEGKGFIWSFNVNEYLRVRNESLPGKNKGKAPSKKAAKVCTLPAWVITLFA